jgi:hypothetical protein
MLNKKNAAKTEKLQQKIEAGFVSAHFPEIDSIEISMIYNQRGISKSVPRVVNFFPGSYAFFRVDCLNKDCVDGGFDLSQVITSMIRNRSETVKGNLGCEGTGTSADHSTIVYEIGIQYV